MANYSQAQKQQYSLILTKTNENIIKCTIWNLQGINQFKSFQPIYLGAWQQLKS
jgi:hypothetical protein